MITSIMAQIAAEAREALEPLGVLVTEDSREALGGLGAGQVVVIIPPPTVIPQTAHTWQTETEVWALAPTDDPRQSTPDLAPVLTALDDMTRATPDVFQTQGGAWAGYRITLTHTWDKEN